MKRKAGKGGAGPSKRRTVDTGPRQDHVPEDYDQIMFLMSFHNMTKAPDQTLSTFHHDLSHQLEKCRSTCCKDRMIRDRLLMAEPEIVVELKGIKDVTAKTVLEVHKNIERNRKVLPLIIPYLHAGELFAVADVAPHLEQIIRPYMGSMESLKLVGIKMKMENLHKWLGVMRDSLKSLYMEKIKLTGGGTFELIMEKHCPNLMSLTANLVENMTFRVAEAPAAAVEPLSIDIEWHRPANLISVLSRKTNEHVILGLHKNYACKYNTAWKAFGSVRHIKELTIRNRFLVHRQFGKKRVVVDEDYYDFHDKPYDFDSVYCKCCERVHDEDKAPKCLLYLTGKRLLRLTVDIFEEEMAKNFNALYFGKLQELNVTQYYKALMNAKELEGLCSLTQLKKLSITTLALKLSENDVLCIVESLDNLVELHLAKFKMPQGFKQSLNVLLKSHGRKLQLIYTAIKKSPGVNQKLDSDYNLPEVEGDEYKFLFQTIPV